MKNKEKPGFRWGGMSATLNQVKRRFSVRLPTVQIGVSPMHFLSMCKPSAFQISHDCFIRIPRHCNSTLRGVSSLTASISRLEAYLVARQEYGCHPRVTPVSARAAPIRPLEAYLLTRQGWRSTPAGNRSFLR